MGRPFPPSGPVSYVNDGIIAVGPVGVPLSLPFLDELPDISQLDLHPATIGTNMGPLLDHVQVLDPSFSLLSLDCLVQQSLNDA